MSEPNDRPPGERRTDAGSRVIVERLDLLARQQAEQAEALADQLEEAREEFTSEVKRLDARIRTRPTKGKVVGWLAGMVVAFWTVTWTVSRSAAGDTKEAVRDELRVLRLEIDNKLKASDLTHQVEHRAIYDAMPKKRRSVVLEQPVQVDGGTPEDAT